MSQIDYIVAFASESAAQADPVVGQYWTAPTADSPGGWRQDICIPGLFVWLPSADVTGTAPDGSSYVTHTPYDALWRMAISLRQRNAALDAHVATHLVTDRDAANAGRAFVLQSALTNAQLSSLMFQPTFAGANYPFGAAH